MGIFCIFGSIPEKKALLPWFQGISSQLVVFCLLLLFLTACSPFKKKVSYQPFEPAGNLHYRETGVASWYGEEFHGRQTANGEIYDMFAMTAAHRTLPFNAWVTVTNRENGKKTEVRINDRGPFLHDRIIDLSQSGAREIGILATGTAPVILEITGFACEAPPSLEGLFSIQVGSFAEKENAQRLKEELDRKFTQVHIMIWESNHQRLFRLRVGAFPTEGKAREFLPTLRKANLTGFVVRED